MSRFNSYCLCYFLFQHNYSTFFYKNYVFYLNIYIQIKFRTKTIKNHELFLKLHSVQFSCSLVDNFLRPHGLQHARLPCPYQFPELAKTHVHWVGDAIQPSLPLSSTSPAFSLFLASGSSPMGQFFASGGQGIGASASVLSMSIQDLLVVQGTLKSLLQHHSSKASILWHSAFLIVQLSPPYMTTGKTIALTR